MGRFEPYFPETYHESRAWFKEQLELVRTFWPSAHLHQYALRENPQLSIDWIQAPCPSSEGMMLVISTGLHGTEGFTGTAVMHYFIQRCLDKLDHSHSGLLLIHGLNPWGMHNRRRTNASNVDLNRNFRHEGGSQANIINTGYLELQSILNPPRHFGNFNFETLRFIIKLMALLPRHGIKALKEAVLLGQINDPTGLHFGGIELQEESRVAWGLLTGALQKYQQLIHIDIHTGYGKSGAMTMVNSTREQSTPEECVQRFGYPSVVRADPDAFYTIQGDMIDALYAWRELNAVHNQYFGTAFEFGTMGDGLIAQIRSLRAMVFENQVAQRGSVSVKGEDVIQTEFRKLFDPMDKKWRQSAMDTTEQALTGILAWYGILEN
jgi:hypothetical protein